MRVLYAGDSLIGGAADYLLAVLKSLRAQVVHLDPSQTLARRMLVRRFDAVILSDFSRDRVPSASERALERQVEDGTGLLMVGGWGSFSGPFGHWRGSRVEQLLPVRCLNRDDRRHFPSGALMTRQQAHPAIHTLSFGEPPAICGLNQVRPAPGSRVILTARPIMVCQGGSDVALSVDAYPLLVMDVDPRRRTAALTTDLAPHWCGGLMDWGRRRRILPVTGAIRVEVGDQYVRFVSTLVRWLAHA